MRVSNCVISVGEGVRSRRSILCPIRLIGTPVLTSSVAVGFSAGGVGDLAVALVLVLVALMVTADAKTGVRPGGTEMDELVRLAGGVSSVSW